MADDPLREVEPARVQLAQVLSKLLWEPRVVDVRTQFAACLALQLRGDLLADPVDLWTGVCGEPLEPVGCALDRAQPEDPDVTRLQVEERLSNHALRPQEEHVGADPLRLFDRHEYFEAEMPILADVWLRHEHRARAAADHHVQRRTRQRVGVNRRGHRAEASGVTTTRLPSSGGGPPSHDGYSVSSATNGPCVTS